MTFDWNAVWERKGKSESSDAYEISGFENFRDFDTAAAAERLVKEMGIEHGDSLFEIGCGAGLLGRHLKEHCHYVGSDRSPAMVRKAIELNKVSVLRCDANDLPFKDKSFDHVLAFCMFHYFPDQAYAQQTIAEMKRIARKSVCISDLPKESHDPNHLLFNEAMFAGWTLTGTLYTREHERFSALLKLS